jgi:hypothetical protein
MITKLGVTLGLAIVSGFPKTHDRVSMSSQRKRSNQKFAPSEMGSMVCLRSSNPAPRMSLEGQSLQVRPRPLACQCPLLLR